MTTNEQPTIFERISTGIRNSITLKLILIAILVLLLLIPMSMVRNIINERESLRAATENEVSDKWARAQVITGPVLTIPLLYERKTDDGEIETYSKQLHILPDNLDISGKVDPDVRSRGIYDVTVYSGDILLEGVFTLKDYRPDNEGLKDIQWENAFLTLGLSDLRGIRETVPFKWNGQQLPIEPGSRIQDLVPSGITYPAAIDPDAGRVHNFNINLMLNGSENLSFTPIGLETNVTITSSWPDPSFTGSFIPDSHSINDAGFEARWNVLQLNRNYPQHWVGSAYASEMTQSEFGVRLYSGLDDYQKSMRSAKYAVMTLALTFLIFFLTEVLNKRRIHPFQYALVGLALCLFYVLLVSLSEHIAFNLAYGISSIAIIAMIVFYAYHVFNSARLTGFLGLLLAGLYGFVFVTLQLA
ncbi:MAG: cell envelope integrity protein CreD, partial [Cyclobacteriaceae bacterium]